MKPCEYRFFGAKEVRVTRSGDTVTLDGHGAVFNSFSEDMGFREIIRPGAFSATLKKNPDVRFLINHDGLPLARTTSGTLSLTEDKIGLRFNAKLDARDPDVQRLVPKVERGDVSQMSFAFRTITDAWRVEDGVDVRELLELDLQDGDVSAVTYPAYQQTDIAVRSREMLKQSHDAWKKRNFNPRLTALKARSL